MSSNHYMPIISVSPGSDNENVTFQVCLVWRYWIDMHTYKKLHGLL